MEFTDVIELLIIPSAKLGQAESVARVGKEQTATYVSIYTG